MGDETVWLNDGVPAIERRYKEVSPTGIEIHQTVFRYKSTGFLENVIFIRYKIINKNDQQKDSDSVYFSNWADPDIVNYLDDLIRSDVASILSGYSKVPTGRNAVFADDNGSDDSYLKKSITFLILLLQSPYIFTGDKLDTAYNKRGPFIGLERKVGLKHLGVSSVVQYFSSSPIIQADPLTHFNLRNYTLGKTREGFDVNPCTWQFGTIVGNVNCSEVNGRYFYSGDPVLNIGWIQSSPKDQRMMINTGPFELRYNLDTVIVITALIFSEDSSAISRIEKVKSISDSVKILFENNFKLPGQVIFPPNSSRFKLEQNYPNTFNSITKIQFTTPVRTKVTIKVYDLLGREITTLLDDEKDPRTYTVKFDGSDLSSGVYLYRIRAGNYSETKKMIFLK